VSRSMKLCRPRTQALPPGSFVMSASLSIQPLLAPKAKSAMTKTNVNGIRITAIRLILCIYKPPQGCYQLHIGSGIPAVRTPLRKASLHVHQPLLRHSISPVSPSSHPLGKRVSSAAKVKSGEPFPSAVGRIFGPPH